MDFADIKVPVNFIPNIDAINAYLKELKFVLGDAGKNIKLIDTEKLKNDVKKATEETKKIGDEVDKVGEKSKKTGEKIKDSFGKAFQFNMIVQGMQAASAAVDQLSQPFIKYESALADLSAITGVTGKNLDMFGDKAKTLASEFGGDAVGQIEAFKGVLSRLGPDIAKSPEALEKMARAINITAKASGLDATTSMDALTTSLLQFNVSLDDPIKASEVMSSMMNTLAAGAKEGAAEIPQVKDAIKAAGVAAYGANLSFEETNAAIQVLATGGKYGAEAGTALRNVLGMIQNASGPAEASMRKMGTSSKELAQILTTQGLEPAVAKLREGMNGLGTDAERNQALMDIFGTENAAAAGILIRKADDIGELRAKITGTNTAFEQAAINMDTTASAIDRFKAKVSNVLTGAFSAFGGGLATVAGSLQTTLPLITTMAGVKTIIPDGAISNIGKFVTASGGIAPALGSAIKSFGSMSYAFLTNPFTLTIAAVAGLTLGIKALSDASRNAAQNQYEESKARLAGVNASIKRVETQKREAEGNLRLIEQYKELANKANKTAAEEEKMRQVKRALIAVYPGVFSGTKDVKEEFYRLEQAALKTKGSIEQYTLSLQKLSRERLRAEQDTKLTARNASVQAAINELMDLQTNFWNYLDQKLYGESLAAGFFDEFSKAIYKSGTKEKTAKAVDDMLTKISQSGLSSDAKEAIKAKVFEVEKAQNEYLAAMKVNDLPPPGGEGGTPAPTPTPEPPPAPPDDGEAKRKAEEEKRRRDELQKYIEEKTKQHNANLKQMDIDALGDKVAVLQRERELIVENQDITENERLVKLLDIDKQIAEEQQKLAIESAKKKQDEALAKEDETYKALEIKTKESLDALNLVKKDIEKSFNDDKLKAEQDYQNKLTDLTLANDRKTKELLKKQNIATLQAQLKLAAGGSTEAIELRRSIGQEMLELEYQDVIGVTGKMTDEQLAKYNEYLDKRRSLELSFQEEMIKTGQDKAIVERDLRILNAEKIYAEELKAAKGNIQAELDAYIKMTDEKMAAQQAYIEQSNIFYSFALEMQKQLIDLKLEEKKVDEEKISRLKEQMEQYDKDTNELQKQFKKKEISQKEFLNRINELNQQKTDTAKELIKEESGTQVDEWKQLQESVSKAFGKIAEKQTAQTAKLIGDRSSLLNASYLLQRKLTDKEAKLSEARAAGRVEEEATLNEEITKIKEERILAEEEAGKKTSDIWMSVGMQMGASFAQMVMDGENAGKALVISAIQALESMIPVFVTMIFGEYASLGPWMLLAAAGVTAALYGLAAIAKSAASKYLYTGGLNDWGGIGEYGLLSPGHKVIHLNDDGTGAPEFVFNPKATRKLLPDLTKLNNYDITLDEYVMKHRPDLVQKIQHDAMLADKAARRHTVKVTREMQSGYEVLEQMKQDGLLYGTRDIVYELREIKKQNATLIDTVEKQNAIIKTKTKLINNFKETGKRITVKDIRGRL